MESTCVTPVASIAPGPPVAKTDSARCNVLAAKCGNNESPGMNDRQEWEISVATAASAAAANVPMSAACTNGIDLRNVRRIDCSQPASC